MSREHQEQVSFITQVRLYESRYPALKWLFAIPNGGDRNKAVAGKLKAEGVKRGVSDLFLSVPVGDFHGLYIEMKRPEDKARDQRKGELSEEQRSWLDDMAGLGYKTEVCFTAGQAWKVTMAYIAPLYAAPGDRD